MPHFMANNRHKLIKAVCRHDQSGKDEDMASWTSKGIESRVVYDVETKGELTRGQTVVDTRANFRWDHLPEIDAAYDADFAKFLDMLVSALAQ